MNKNGLCSGPCASCDKERLRSAQIAQVMVLMIENLDRVDVPLPPGISPGRVPALKLEAKAIILKALDKYLLGRL
jgi:hypothetical protein